MGFLGFIGLVGLIGCKLLLGFTGFTRLLGFWCRGRRVYLENTTSSVGMVEKQVFMAKSPCSTCYFLSTWFGTTV